MQILKLNLKDPGYQGLNNNQPSSSCRVIEIEKKKDEVEEQFKIKKEVNDDAQDDAELGSDEEVWFVRICILTTFNEIDCRLMKALLKTCLIGEKRNPKVYSTYIVLYNRVS